MTSHIITAGGKRIELPVGEEDVNRHFSWPGSYTDEILRQINDAKFYEPLFAGQRDLVLFDLGANVGLVSIHASDVCRLIVAVEPSTHFPLLCKLTSPFPHIRPVQCALHSRNEDILLSLCDSNSTAHSTVVPVGPGAMRVQGKTLAGILQPHVSAESSDGKGFRDCMVKVDVEGAEMEALTEEQIKQVHPTVATFYVESHPYGGRGYPENRDILKGRFESQGYAVQVIDNQAIIARRK